MNYELTKYFFQFLMNRLPFFLYVAISSFQALLSVSQPKDIPPQPENKSIATGRLLKVFLGIVFNQLLMLYFIAPQYISILG